MACNQFQPQQWRRERCQTCFQPLAAHAQPSVPEAAGGSSPAPSSPEAPPLRPTPSTASATSSSPLRSPALPSAPPTVTASAPPPAPAPPPDPSPPRTSVPPPNLSAAPAGSVPDVGPTTAATAPILSPAADAATSGPRSRASTAAPAPVPPPPPPLPPEALVPGPVRHNQPPPAPPPPPPPGALFTPRRGSPLLSPVPAAAAGGSSGAATPGPAAPALAAAATGGGDDDDGPGTSAGAGGTSPATRGAGTTPPANPRAALLAQLSQGGRALRPTPGVTAPPSEQAPATPGAAGEERFSSVQDEMAARLRARAQSAPQLPAEGEAAQRLLRTCQRLPALSAAQLSEVANEIAAMDRAHADWRANLPACTEAVLAAGRVSNLQAAVRELERVAEVRAVAAEEAAALAERVAGLVHACRHLRAAEAARAAARAAAPGALDRVFQRAFGLADALGAAHLPDFSPASDFNRNMKAVKAHAALRAAVRANDALFSWNTAEEEAAQPLAVRHARYAEAEARAQRLEAAYQAIQVAQRSGKWDTRQSVELRAAAGPSGQLREDDRAWTWTLHGVLDAIRTGNPQAVERALEGCSASVMRQGMAQMMWDVCASKSLDVLGAVLRAQQTILPGEGGGEADGEGAGRVAKWLECAVRADFAGGVAELLRRHHDAGRHHDAAPAADCLLAVAARLGFVAVVQELLKHEPWASRRDRPVNAQGATPLALLSTRLAGRERAGEAAARGARDGDCQVQPWLLQEEFADVEVRTADGDVVGPAHRVVLAAGSEVLHAAMRDTWQREGGWGHVVLPAPAGPEEGKLVLQWLYSGALSSLPSGCVGTAAALMQVADALLMEKLVQKCEAVVVSNLEMQRTHGASVDPANVEGLLDLGEALRRPLVWKAASIVVLQSGQRTAHLVDRVLGRLRSPPPSASDLCIVW